MTDTVGTLAAVAVVGIVLWWHRRRRACPPIDAAAYREVLRQIAASEYRRTRR